MKLFLNKHFLYYIYQFTRKHYTVYNILAGCLPKLNFRVSEYKLCNQAKDSAKVLSRLRYLQSSDNSDRPLGVVMSNIVPIFTSRASTSMSNAELMLSSRRSLQLTSISLDDDRIRIIV